MEITRDRQNWFGSLFRRIQLNLTNIFDQKMATIGITSSHYWILKLLWNGDGLTQKQLVSALSVKPASLTGMIDTMVEKGWVTRSSDPHDARVNRIFLTTKGKELEILAADIITECEETVCKGFTKEELEVFKPLLIKVLRNLEKPI
jgi:MarR family transcriptional regulator, organic hydroperoxide resistance regulator